jgi:DNA repair protein RecN (Recombination protein N)
VLRHLSLRDFVIVEALEVDLDAGFSVLTGETGAGKSILIDALQLALGSRGDAGVVREGAARAEIGAEFDTPASLVEWLAAGGFESEGALLLRRSIDGSGRSRAWINGSAATLGQLREAADHLVDIHGQHAWQSLTRAPAVRALLDAYAAVDTGPLAGFWSRWKAAGEALGAARARQADRDTERERLVWQIGELDKLSPGDGEWQELDAEHRKLANMQALIDAARLALEALSQADDNAEALAGRAADALQAVARFDERLTPAIEALQGALAQLADASHTLASYLHHTDTEPDRLRSLDERMAAWVGLARRYRRPPAELPALLAQWQGELRSLDAAADLDALQRTLATAAAELELEAVRISTARRAAAPQLAAAVTQTMQQLGMAGGRFEVALTPLPAAQAFGLESAEFLVAGHEGSTPRPLAKVASGGELSRIALGIAVTTSQWGAAGTLIFDEVDAGVGGAVADTVGRLMKQLGRDRQVLAVTHLPQVAACADRHFVVSKASHAGTTRSRVDAVAGEARVAEIARMLGGEHLSGTSLAHAQELLSVAAASGVALPRGRKRS